MFSGFFKRPPPDPEPSLFPEFQPGGGYRLLSQIDGGTDHLLFKARDPLGEIVALRVWQHYDENTYRRARRWVGGQKALVHPSLAPFVQAAQRNDALCLSRAYLEGPSLARKLEDGPLPLRELLDCLAQLASALQVTSRHKISCRNWKKENVLWHRDRWVLTDLEAGLPYFNGEAWAGSPPPSDYSAAVYLAPEQVTGSSVGCAADLYSLGVLAYELLTGRPPFVGDPVQVIVAALSEQPTPLRDLCDHVSPQLEDLVERLLCKDPEQRASLSPLDVERALNGQALVVHSGRETGPELAGYLAELREDGMREDSGEFTLDSRRALEKLRDFQFLSPHDGLIPLLAAASSLEASSLRVTTSRDGLQLEYDCPSLSEGDMESLFSHAFMRKRGKLSHLALGIAGALNLGETSSQVEILSGESRLTLTKLEPLVAKPGNFPGLTIRVSRIQPPVRVPEHLAKLFRYCEVPLFWNDQRINTKILRPAQPALIAGRTYFISTALESEDPGLFFGVDGMTFPDAQSLVFPEAMALVSGPWKLDISYRELVNEAHSRAVRQHVQVELERAAEELAMAGPLNLRRPYIYERILRLWESQQQVEKLNALHGHIVESFSDEDESFHAMVLHSCRFVRGQRLKQFKQASRILTWPMFGRDLEGGWQGALALAQDAFGQEQGPYWRFLLRIWLTLDSVQPPQQSLHELLQHLDVFEEDERISLDEILFQRVHKTLPWGCFPTPLPAGLARTQEWLHGERKKAPDESEAS